MSDKNLQTEGGEYFSSFQALIKHLSELQRLQFDSILKASEQHHKTLLGPMGGEEQNQPTLADYLEYWIDFTQSNLLYWDALRKSSDNILANMPAVKFLRKVQPFGLQQYSYSSLNPAFSWLASSASLVSDARKPISSDNPLLAWQEVFSKLVEVQLNVYREILDASQEMGLNTTEGAVGELWSQLPQLIEQPLLTLSKTTVATKPAASAQPKAKTVVLDNEKPASAKTTTKPAAAKADTVTADKGKATDTKAATKPADTAKPAASKVEAKQEAQAAAKADTVTADKGKATDTKATSKPVEATKEPTKPARPRARKAATKTQSAANIKTEAAKPAAKKTARPAKGRARKAAAKKEAAAKADTAALEAKKAETK